MKVVYMGTPDFAVGPLEAIIKAGHEVTAVVTQPDKPKGRGKEMAMSPVKEYALQYQIPVLTPVKIKAAEAVEELKQYPADIFVVAAFGQIIPKEILEKYKGFGFYDLDYEEVIMPEYAIPIEEFITDYIVDITDNNVSLYDDVVLIGKDKQNQIFICDVAAWCDTIGYEIISRLSQRIKRRYKSGEICKLLRESIEQEN